MQLECTIPYITTEGFQYLLKFTPFRPDILPETISCTIVDLTIEGKKEYESVNRASSLFTISEIIENYLSLNDVVLYCYCDHSEIFKNVGKNELSNQQYRSRLFSLMFQRRNSGNYINERIILNDHMGNHYIHLISKKSNEYNIAEISANILKFQDK